MVGAAAWRIFQMLSSIWIQKKTLDQFHKISQKSAITYVEGVKTLRSATILLSFVLLLIICLAAAVGILIHGVLTLKALSPEDLAWMEITVSGILLFVVIAGILILMSEKLWIRLFKIDDIVNGTSDDQKPILFDRHSNQG